MKIAILGAGGIARAMCATIRGMKEAGRPVELYAVASRDIDKAIRFAREQGVRRAYGSYEDMLADPAVELVYIATPHSHHAEQMKMCINAGKAVLCEKSFTANAAQAEEVLALAREKGVYVAEAIWTRYMPSRRIIDDLIAADEIGQPLLLTSNLAYTIEAVERIRQPELAGGALLDVGVYTLNFASMVFGDDIESMQSHVEMLPTGVDRTENITLRYGSGRTAMLMASAAFNSDRRCVVYGTKGYLTVDNVNNPGFIEVFDKDERIRPRMHIDVPTQITGYEYEVEACLRDIPLGRLEPEEMPHSEVMTIMRQMDALRAQWGMTYPFE
ncbi:MAG: Gfo/Idh/MocA family oxidoreductase [Clostridia bacterium]|nr:Gfo/Idh/MocA family oxidoreductase [Clostridia bacterium]